MRFVKGLSVGKKLYFSFALVVALLMLVVGLSLRGFGTLASATSNITKVATPKHDAAAGLKYQAATVLAWQTTYLLDRGKSRRAFVEASAAFERGVAKLNQLSTDYHDRQSLAAISAAFARYAKSDAQEWAAVERGDLGAAVKIGWASSVPAYRRLTAALVAYEKQAHAEVTTDVASFDSTRSSTQLISLVVGAIAILLATGLAILIARAIKGPLVKVQRAAQAVAGGDLTVTLDVDSRDEVGETASAFEQMVASFNGIVGKVAETAGVLSSASQQMASTSDEAGRAVSEIASAVGDVAQGAERQVRMVEDARRSADEVLAAVKESSDNAQRTAEVANEARQIAESGVTAAQEATEAMVAVRESTQSVTEAIVALADKSEQIGGIVATITGIAGQTNLLALNAAIEAARAGEQGRGFAVVAEEVRKLAEESQGAAAMIAELVEQIQAETQRTVTVVEDGAARTEAGAATVEQAREAFLRIGSSVDDVTGRIEQIATASQSVAARATTLQSGMAEVAAVAEESSASTEQVSASTQQTSASAQEIAASAQQLATTAEELRLVVGEFKLAA
jgi:methyl-accepting chemotaxis protein